MATLTVDVQGDGMRRFENVASALSEGEVRRIASRALNHAGNKARTQVKRELAKQTGLPQKVIQRALKVRPATVGNPKFGGAGARMEYTIESKGGDIALKYFNPTETRAGVKASPFGKRELFEGTFLKGGRFPNRKTLSMGGHVFELKDGSTKWGRKIKIAKSGVIIPNEMVTGASAAAFSKGAAMVSDRLSHEMARSAKLRDLTGGAIY